MTFPTFAEIVRMTQAEWDLLVRGKSTPPWTADPEGTATPQVAPPASTERVMPARALRHQIQRVGLFTLRDRGQV